MRLIELSRTTGFRLAAMFVTAFGVVQVLLFGYLYIQITGFDLERVDDWLMREHAALLRQPPQNVAAAIEHHTTIDPRGQFPFALFDAEGRRIAGAYTGDRPPIPQFGKPFSMRILSTESVSGSPARCIAERLDAGRVALQCQVTRDIDHFDEELLHALVIAGVAMLAIGIVYFTVASIRFRKVIFGG